jgi:(p)ppGpp synthase/HD superfamily hydrolase
MNHLAEVALLVAEATAGEDPALVAAAYLHDVIEDTPTTAPELRERFGEEVAALVLEVTDDKQLSRTDQKGSQVAKGATRSSRANLIKLADKISNLTSLATSPPVNWSALQKSEYIEFSTQVVAAMGGVSPFLEAKFAKAAERARHSLVSA